MTIPERSASLYYVVPAQIFEDPDLEWPEIAFYALLSGLSNHKGYCYATNKYLATRMRKGTEQIERFLKKLEDLGYLTRISIQKGTLWDRKIYINHDFKKCLPSLTDEATVPHTRGIDPSLMRHPIVSEVRVSKDNLSIVSPEVETLKKLFWEAIKKAKPNFSKKPTKNWDEKIGALLKVRSAEQILKALNWALNDSFWKSNVLSPNGLYKNLDIIETKMAGNPTKEDRQILIDKHSKQALDMDTCGKKSTGLQVAALREKVEFNNGPKVWFVPYDVSDEEWKEKTGWKDEPRI